MSLASADVGVDRFPCRAEGFPQDYLSLEQSAAPNLILGTRFAPAVKTTTAPEPASTSKPP
jgi:hypothetical protein